MKIDLIAFNCRYSHSCLALFYVRNELKKHLPSCHSTIRQFTINDPYYETLLQISGSPADAFFFSAYIWNAQYLGRLLADLHRAVPQIPVVLGGPQASALRNCLDFPVTVAVGEIEGLDPNFYSDLEQGCLKIDYKAGPASHFDSPYKQEDFTGQLKNRNIYYETSRGCPFSCTYCLSSISRGISTKKTSQVKEELGAIIKHRPKVIRFVDRTFNADPERALEIWQFLKDNTNGETCFHFEIAPDRFSDAMFDFLKDLPPGFFQFEIGIQSTTPETLAAVNRQMDLSKAKSNIKRLVALNNIHLHLDLILGLPHETQEKYLNSFTEIFSLGPHYVQMGLLKILPDTAISRSMKEFGLVVCSQPPYQIMANAWLDHAALSRLFWFGECVEAFFNNRYFKTFFTYLNTLDNDIAHFFDRLLNISLERNLFQLAKTQKFLSEILFQLMENDPDPLFRELLIYDWLLCGHRFLPDYFEADLKTDKDFLWQNMPEKVTGLYDHHGRNDFFKRSIFFKFSGQLLSFTGLPQRNKGGYVVFLPENRPGVMKHCRTVFLEVDGSQRAEG